MYSRVNDDANSVPVTIRLITKKKLDNVFEKLFILVVPLLRFCSSVILSACVYQLMCRIIHMIVILVACRKRTEFSESYFG